MRRFLLFILLLVPLCVFSQDPWRHAVRYTIEHGGLEREYYLLLPKDLSRGVPLVIYLHGYTGKAEGAFPELLLEAERSGFALAIPQGHVDATGHTCWNVGYPFQEGLQTDDVDFLCVLSEHLQKTFGLSREATFLTGMSNGGEMCYLMAALRPDVFRAVAPISGLQMLWAYRQLKPQKPVPLMELHGTDDTTSRWQGDPEGKDGWGGYIGVELAVMNWANRVDGKRGFSISIGALFRTSTLHRTYGSRIRRYIHIGVRNF